MLGTAIKLRLRRQAHEHMSVIEYIRGWRLEHPNRTPGVEVKFPNFDIRSDQVALRADIMSGETEVAPLVLQHKEYLAVMLRCH